MARHGNPPIAIWARANAEFHPTELGNEQSFVASVFRWPSQSRQPELWVTNDSGQNWSQIGTSAGDTFLFPTFGAPELTPSAQHPWYALRGEQVNYVTIYETSDLKTWTTLPPLITSNAQPDVTKALAVLPNGNIVALAKSPSAFGTPTPVVYNSPLQLNYMLWVWNPHAARWGVVEAQLPLTLVGCGLCSANFTTLAPNDSYIWIWNPPAQGLYRIKLPSM
jgi:hypothetical protein